MFLVRIAIILILLLVIVSLIGFGVRLVNFTPIDQALDEEIVRPMPKWVTKINLPHFSSDAAHAIYPYIYLPQEEYAEFREGEISTWLAGVLVHQRSHLDRQEYHHPLVVGVKYLFAKKYRLEEELLAIKDQMKFLKDGGEKEYPIEDNAKQLSSKEYGKMISEEEAIEILTNLWTNADNEEDS